MAAQREERRLAAILSADVAGYSRLMGADESGTLARLKSHRKEVIDPKIAGHHGRIVKLMGDGVLVEFASVVDATRCAAEMQQAMADRNADVAEAQRIDLRIGINLGDIIVDGDDIYGDGVNVAARLQEMAEPGATCVSGVVFDSVKGKLELGFKYLGPQRVKNIAEPVRAYRVLPKRPRLIEDPERISAIVQPVLAAGVSGLFHFFFAMLLVKGLWAWTISGLFPGAVEQGLVAASISWWTSAKIAIFIAVLSGFAGEMRRLFQSDRNSG